MALSTPPVIVKPFGAEAGAGYITNPIPVDSQELILPGAASFDTGFPPLTMTEGGVPPSGKDFNGILFALSAYCAWLQAGMGFPFSTDVADAGGYPIGAVVRSAADLSNCYYNTTADNTNNPDSVITGWVKFSLIGGGQVGAQTSTLAAGTTNNLAVTGSVGFLDITANASGSDLTGLNGGVNGQQITITNVSANTLTLKALTGSSAGNQFRLATDLTLAQYSTQTFRKSTTLGVWVPV